MLLILTTNGPYNALPSMSDWQTLGAHRFRSQDDVLCFEPHGELPISQAQRWLQLLAAHFQQHPDGILIVDARQFTPPSAEVRRLFLSHFRDRRPAPPIIVFGANLLMRAASRLVLSAARQLYLLEFDLIHCSLEADAWTRVEQRHRLRQPEP